MFTKELFTEEHFDKGLVAALGDRLDNGAYTDAIIVAGKYLTEVLREKGQVDGDGSQLAGEVLGGSAPNLRLNKLQTQSEKDEQQGVLQIVMGYYRGIRNPRHHDHVEDTEDFCIRVLVLIDTLLDYLNRDVQEFDVTAVVNRIYEPHFVPNREYAQALMSEIPEKFALAVFTEAFDRRAEGTIAEIRFAFHALVDMMNEEDATLATNMVGKALGTTEEHADIANLLRLLKPSSWPSLKDNVRLRLENILIQECNKGYFDIFSGQVKGKLGSWANTFGHFFDRREELGEVILNRLHQNWYSQNYVAKYLINALPRIITGDEMIKNTSDALASAAIVNEAKLLRSKMLEVCGNYPDEWREALTDAVNERRDNDEEYAIKLLVEIVSL
jgi:uncharacterized protein (TIGR02391 family)